MTSDRNGNIATLMGSLGASARVAASKIAVTTDEQRAAALRLAATGLRNNCAEILNANAGDTRRALDAGLGASMLDRLMLNKPRIEAMATSLEAVSAHPDPVGRVDAEWERPNGLVIRRVTVPIGVIGIIYESRPNVTADAAALCIKSGNAAILRGGSESFRTNTAIHGCIVDALVATDLDAELVQLVPTRDRDAVGFLLSSMAEWVDVVIPRGGRNLVQRVQAEARVPVIGHLEGNCHVYVHASADLRMARDIVVNAKMRRTGICGAAETVLVDRAIAKNLLPDLCADLVAAGCEIRGDDTVLRHFGDAVQVNDDDWAEEYLDAIVAMRVVEDIETAIEHIQVYGSGHTESIVADNAAAASRFLSVVDSAIVLHNASTQFADGGEFGMGAEIGIATGRIHARGPVGADQLTSYKYVVRGSGQIRP